MLGIHSQAKFKSQNVGEPLFGIFKNSMLPLYNEELVPPSVKMPPYAVSVA